MQETRFDTPEATEAAFYQAIAGIDLDLMTRVWSDGGHALCIHPGSGLLRGKPAVIQSWRDIFSNSNPPVIEYRYIDGYGTGDIRVRLVEERIRPRNTPPDAANRVLATNIFLREGRSWRMAVHHASLPLVDRTEEPAPEHRLH